MGTSEADNRRSLRRRILKGGIVAFNDRHVTLACTVRDISVGGARLRIMGSVSPPNRFELLIELDGLEVPCEVVRRDGNEIAVMFLSEPRRIVPKRSQIVDPLLLPQTPSIRRKPKPNAS